MGLSLEEEPACPKRLTVPGCHSYCYPLIYLIPWSASCSRLVCILVCLFTRSVHQIGTVGGGWRGQSIGGFELSKGAKADEEVDYTVHSFLID